MTIIISATKAGFTHEVQGETLEDLRKQLVDELLGDDRAVDGWQDQIEAVYPADASEVDEDAETPTPRPLTEGLLIDLACKVWDVPAVDWQTADEAPRPLTRGELQATQHYLGLSISELAVKLNVHERTLRRWIAGASPIPGGIALELRLLLETFEDDVDHIVARAGQPGAVTIYPEDENEQQLDGRPLGWERRVLQEAHTQEGVGLLFAEEV